MSEEVVNGVSVQNPLGQFETLAPAEVPGALAAGYQLDTPQLRAEMAQREKYSGLGGAAAAFGLGALSTPTFGLGPLALAKTGIVTSETQKAIAEAQPEARMAGEATGLLAPGLGEAGYLGKGAEAASRLANTGIRAVGEAGEGITSLAAKQFGDSLVGKAAAKALGTAGELEAYNVANNIDESALGDHELTAQSLLAHSGEALAIGGGLGFMMPVASKAITATAGKANAALDVLRGITAKLPEGFAEKQAAANADAVAAGDLTAKETITNPADIGDMTAGIGTPEGAKMRQGLGEQDFLTPEESDQLQKDFRRAVDDARSTMRSVKSSLEQARPDELEDLLNEHFKDTAFAPTVAESELPGIPAKKLPPIRSNQRIFETLKDASGIDDYDASQADQAYLKWKAGAGPKPEPFEGGHFDMINERLDLKGRRKVSGGQEAFDQLMKGNRTWEGVKGAIKELQGVKGLEDLRLPDDIQERLLPAADESFDFGHNVEAKALGDTPAQVQARSLADKIGSTIQEMESRPALYAATMAEELKDIQKEYLGRLAEADSPVKLFDVIDETKSALNKKARWQQNIAETAQPAVEKVRDLTREFKGNLIDENLWGKACIC